MRVITSLFTAVIVAAIGISCAGKDNDTFGRIPEMICAFKAGEAKDTDMLSTAQTDRLYSKIYPMFEKTEGQLIPFTVDEGLGYDVQSVRIDGISASCDISATVRMRIVKDIPAPARMFFKAVTAVGSAIGRGLVIIDGESGDTDGYSDGERLEGQITFRMVHNCEGYKQFAKITFISRSSFNEAAKELRERTKK